VANGILEKQPGHMLALRARALLLSNFGDLAADQLRFKSAIPFYDAAARDYQSLLKVDAGNTISWNNLAANFMNLGLYSEGAGRARDGLKYLRAATRTGSEGAMTAARANGMTSLWWHVARMEAEQGNAEASQAAMSELTRHAELAVRDMPANAATRKIREAWPVKYEAMRQFLLGNFPAAREKAAAAIRQLEPLKPEFEGAKRFRNMELADNYATLADAAYAMKDYAQAEDAARRGLAARLAAPPQSRIEEFFLSEHHTQHALALARLGRLAEARTALAPALELHHRFPDASEAEWVRERRARVRLAQALATPEEAPARLAEAAALIDGLSAEYRGMATVVQARNEIALEQARRR